MKGKPMLNILGAIKTLSPLHCGIGTGMNDIDLPVARNKVSGHPLIPGSTMKGVIKDEFRGDRWNEDVEALFGADNPDGQESKAFASAISMGDAILLTLPVRSFYGTFAYLASPYTLQQFKAVLARTTEETCPAVPTHLGLQIGNDSYRVMLTHESLLKSPDDSRVLFEELDLLVDDDNGANAWADLLARHFCDTDEEKMLFKKRFAIADDNALNFLCDTALPVDARIALDEKTGTVKQGALWYEETVPAETLFFSMIGVDRSFKKEVKKTPEDLAKILIPAGESREMFTQMGGKSTTGKGFVSVRFIKGA